MTAHLLEATAFLSLLAFLPVATVAGIRPASVFLCPLGGALLGAWAAELELVVGGSFLTDLLIVAACVNGATLAYRWFMYTGRLPRVGLMRGRGRLLATDAPLSQSPVWMAITLVAMAAAVAWPLQALRVPIIGYDANMVWLMHAILVYSGHTSMLSGIRNPMMRHNPGYPPLVPASSAVGFIMNNGIDLRIGVATTAMLNACALGVLGSGIAEISGAATTAWRRLAVTMVAAAIGLIGFGIAGEFGIDGFADLTWAAPAAAAVVFGLVLPRSSQRLWVAWISLTVAALTKNEGMVAGVTIAILLSLRYVNPAPGSPALTWARRGAAAGAFLLPCLTWSALMRHYHVGSAFLGRSPRGEPPLERLGPTISGTAHYLHILPIALLVLLLGSIVLQAPRRRAQLGNPSWLWAVAVANLLALVGTYVFGAPEIHWWLRQSLNRTTIFTQLILYTDIAIWAAVAALPRPTRADRKPPAEPQTLDSPETLDSYVSGPSDDVIGFISAVSSTGPSPPPDRSSAGPDSV